MTIFELYHKGIFVTNASTAKFEFKPGSCLIILIDLLGLI